MRALLLTLWRLSPLSHFAIPLVGIAAVVVLRWFAPASALEHQPYMLFTAVVAASALAGGLWPGVLASAMSLILSTSYLLETPGAPSGIAIANLVAAGITMLILTMLGHLVRREALGSREALLHLRNDRANLGFLLDSIKDGLLTVDSSWRVVYANHAIRELAGQSSEAVVGTSLWELAGEDQLDFREALESARARGDDVVWDLRRGERQFEVNAVPNDEDTFLYVRDVTEARRAEAQRVALLELERDARHRAEEAARTKDDFLLAISHELRTPLTSILGWLEITQADQSAATAVRARDAIERSARTQVRLVGQLLDLANLRSGRLTLASDIFELNEAAAQSVRNLDAVRIEGGHELAYSPAPVPLLIKGDQDQLVKALDAMLDNAYRYTPSPGRISLRVVAAGSSAVLEIEDSGIGIAEEFLPFLFDRFRQGERIMTRQYNGLGLGLTIARSIIDLHGGVIELVSRAGSGSTFHVRLPLSAMTGEVLTENALPGLTSADSLKGCRILLVDDDPSTRDILGRFLESLGASVLLAPSGESALNLALREAIDIIVSDIGMPGMSGLELMEHLRREPRTSHLKALALSAYSESDVFDLCKAAGFHEFANKPIGRAELLAKIAALMRAG